MESFEDDVQDTIDHDHISLSKPIYIKLIKELDNFIETFIKDFCDKNDCDKATLERAISAAIKNGLTNW